MDGLATEFDIHRFGLLVITINLLSLTGDDGVLLKQSHHYKTLEGTVSSFTSFQRSQICIWYFLYLWMTAGVP